MGRFCIKPMGVKEFIDVYCTSRCVGIDNMVGFVFGLGFGCGFGFGLGLDMGLDWVWVWVWIWVWI